MRIDKEIIDLSHMIEEDIPVFKGLKPKIYPFMTHENSRAEYNDKAEFEITKIEFITSIGTYIDSPYHRHRDMDDISRMRIENLILIGILAEVPCNSKRAIYPEDIDVDVSGKAVLIHTGWDKYWKKPEYFNHPYVSRELAEYFVENDTKLVGIDTLNIDNPDDLSRPAHTILLGNNIPIVENLTNLGALMGREFRFFATPVKVKAAAFPVRAFAEVMR
jgi:kynurenine formamidase